MRKGPRRTFANLSLKRKIWIAVSLITLIPLLAVFYTHDQGLISFWSVICLWLIVFVGWGIIFKIIYAFRRIFRHSGKALDSIGEEMPFVFDEVQGLESAIKILSDKVKFGFEQIKDFTQKTDQLNREVSKKVLILSTILQANDLFSKDAPADEVVRFLTYHLQQLLETDVCFCCLKENSSKDLKVIACAGSECSLMDKFIKDNAEDLLRVRHSIVLDSSNKESFYSSLLDNLAIENITIIPIILKNKVMGMVGVGSRKKGFSFSKDDFDILNLFAQNVTLIWEHEQLSSKIESLEIVDYLTGLYNERLIIDRLNEEIKRAGIYQRPCGFLRAEITNFSDYQKRFGQIEGEKALKEAAKIFRGVLKSIDIAGRIGPSAFGAILIETNKRHSKDTAEELRQRLVKAFSDELEFIFSVAENPVDGSNAKALLDFASSHSLK
ncbi:MAG: GGDEF domain-containing protein [Candidatus Omnitrophica bacterium]|nr:GGDEF domain-containing protein [Candidatus Omnitrophota bacterium]